jgi:hypothetical protein
VKSKLESFFQGRGVTMKTIKVMDIFVAAVVLVLCFSTLAAAASCESLTSLVLPDTEIMSAQLVPAGGSLPGGTVAPMDVCRVQGAISSNINFEVWMPAKNQRLWSGKFNGVGNGELAGFINYGAMSAALERGYATASTDTGHQAFLGDGSWALNRPENCAGFPRIPRQLA